MTDPYEARLHSLGLRIENAERLNALAILDLQKMGS